MKRVVVTIVALIAIFWIACWYISNNISGRRSKAEKRQQVEAAVQDMVTKHAAIADWKQQFKKEDMLRSAVYTIELEDALLGTDSHSIMFFAGVQDVVRNADSYSVSFHNLFDIPSGLSIHYVLDCTQEQVDEITRNRERKGRSWLMSNYAVVANVASIEKCRLTVLTEEDEEVSFREPVIQSVIPFNVFMAKGHCLDLLFIGDYEYWED